MKSEQLRLVLSKVDFHRYSILEQDLSLHGGLDGESAEAVIGRPASNSNVEGVTLSNMSVVDGAGIFSELRAVPLTVALPVRLLVGLYTYSVTRGCLPSRYTRRGRPAGWPWPLRPPQRRP